MLSETKSPTHSDDTFALPNKGFHVSVVGVEVSLLQKRKSENADSVHRFDGIDGALAL